MHAIKIQNANIVLPGEVIHGGSLLVRDGLIAAIQRRSHEDTDASGAETIIDANGAIVMPGIIDMHTDALDMEIVPRPGADIPIKVAFRELERKMSGCGFTTVFHSLHLGYDVADGQSRSKFTRRQVFETVHAAAAGPTLINNKIHLRFELTGVKAYETCLEFIRAGMIELLSVMDHTPGQGQWGKEDFIKAMQRHGKSEDVARAEFEEMNNRPRIQGDMLVAMIALAKEFQIPIASHDDDTPEKVEFMQKLGVTICEFPINLETAHYAAKRGMHVAGGASNILRGGSLSGNLSMLEAVKQGAVDTLCSDYYPPSILHSVFKLHLQEDMPLPDAVNLATLNPAKTANIHHHTGSIEPGKHADLLILELVDGLPVLTHTLVKGHVVFRAVYPKRVHEYKTLETGSAIHQNQASWLHRS